MITQELVAEFFEHKDGKLYWKKMSHSNKDFLIGSEAGAVHKTGYRHVTWLGTKHKIHRLIFLLLRGYLPKELDHINGNRLDNRIENLREVTRSENQYNKRPQQNSSGHRGVSWHKKTMKWCVRVTKDKISHSFGYFDDLELAALVAKEARIKLFGNFAYEARIN